MQYSGSNEMIVATLCNSARSSLVYFPRFSVDATLCEDRLGRYVNDSTKPNVKIDKLLQGTTVHLCMYALTDILPGTELRYNYNAPDLWWRKDVSEY